MPDTRDLVFDRVLVDHLVRGGTRVSWQLFYQFTDPGPYTFRLQAGATGAPGADDWRDVGDPVENAFFAVDDARRLTGTNPVTHYRVALTTPLGAYLSRPAAVYGLLGKHDWLIAREILRKEVLRNARQLAVPGLLLKRRRAGAGLPADLAADPRTMVEDPITGDIIKRQTARATLGTPYLGGYYKPVPSWAVVEPSSWYEQVDPQARGNVDDDALVVPARMTLFPAVAHRDVFVAEGSDLRYAIHKVKVEAHVRGVPLVGTVELRQLPFSDIVYSVDPATL